MKEARLLPVHSLMPSSRTKDHIARLDQSFQDEISKSLAQALKDNPNLTPQEVLLSIQRDMLEHNPYTPPKDGSCPINKLPSKLLASIFRQGIDMQHEEWEEMISDEGEWEDVDDDDEAEDSDEDGNDADESSESPSSAIVDDRDTFPLQVLVSHICRRWRSLALHTPELWTAFTFRKQLRLDKAKAYISRSGGSPLRISVDCQFPYQDQSEEGDIQEHDECRIKQSCLSLEDLSQILDLLDPETFRLQEFSFRANTYNYVHLLLARLQKMPAAQLLESFQIYLNRDQDDHGTPSPSDGSLGYLPFQGQVPNLKEVTLCGVPIDWDSATFLRGLRRLGLENLSTDIRPSYPTFAQTLKASPELEALSLSRAGPSWPDGASEEIWSRELLIMPSLKELSLKYHDPSYASALIRRVHLPNLKKLSLYFNDGIDCSEFVRVLAKPVEDSRQSVLQRISQLTILGLPCDVASMEIFLSQLTALKSLSIPTFGEEEEMIFEKIIDPTSLRCAETVMGGLPGVFCPQLEEVIIGGCDGGRLKKFIISRRDAGAPLKRMVLNENDDISKEDEHWIRRNVQDLRFTTYIS